MKNGYSSGSWVSPASKGKIPKGYTSNDKAMLLTGFMLGFISSLLVVSILMFLKMTGIF